MHFYKIRGQPITTQYTTRDKVKNIHTIVELEEMLDRLQSMRENDKRRKQNQRLNSERRGQEVS